MQKNDLMGFQTAVDFNACILLKSLGDRNCKNHEASDKESTRRFGSLSIGGMVTDPFQFSKRLVGVSSEIIALF